MFKKRTKKAFLSLVMAIVFLMNQVVFVAAGVTQNVDKPPRTKQTTAKTETKSIKARNAAQEVEKGKGNKFLINPKRAKLEEENSKASGSKVKSPQAKWQKKLDSFNAKNIVPGEIIVKFKEGADPKKVHNVTKPASVKNLAFKNTQLVRIKKNDNYQNVLAKYQKDPKVEYAEPNYVRKTLAAPTDPGSQQQWALPKMEVPEAWDLVTPSADVTVAVIDSGVDMDHIELEDALLRGKDFVDGDYYPNDLHGHGTHVAGIIAAASNNDEGIAGVAPGVKILPVRVINAEGFGNAQDTADAIRWAADKGANVINLSLGSYYFSNYENDAVQYAYNQGVVVVAAAGNEAGTDNPIEYPAAYDHVISVGATTSTDERADFSNFRNYVDVTAPGENIYSTLPNDQYYALSGTSMASPQVAGVAALILSQNASLTPDQVEFKLKVSAEDLGTPGHDIDFGWGRINAKRALAPTDANEPNGDQASSKDLVASDSVLGTVYDNDQDWFKFSVDGSGAKFSLEPSANLDAKMEIIKEGSVGSTLNQNGRGAAETITVEEAGVYYIKVTNNNVLGGQDGYYRLTAYSRDFNESNDSFSSATSINAGEDAAANIGTADDIDIYKVTLSEAGILKFSLEVPATMDGVLNLFDSAGNWLSDVDDNIEGEAEDLLKQVPAGDYFIQVNNYDETSAVTEEYTLSVGFTKDTTDPNEPNDTLAWAKELPLNKVTTGNINHEGDWDVFKLNIPEAGTISISLETPGNMDGLLWLFDEYRIYNSADDGINGDAEVITYRFDGPGTYYLEVDDYYGNAINEDYNLDVTFEANGYADSYEENNSIAKAVAINFSQVVKAKINPLGDKDFYKITMPAGKKLALSLDTPWNMDGVITLYDSNGNYITEEDDFSDGDQEVLLKLLKAGTYYIAVEDYKGKTYNFDYILKATLLNSDQTDPFESNDDISTATNVQLGQAVKARINDEDDHDYYKFEIEEAGTAHINVRQSPEYMDAVITLFDIDGQEIAEGDETGWGEADALIKSLEPGTYYARVSDYWEESYNQEYTFSVELTASSDDYEPNDTLEEAAIIKPNDLIEAKINYEFDPEDDGDIDYYQFTVPEAGDAVLYLFSPEDMDGMITLYDSAGGYVDDADGNREGGTEVLEATLEAGTYYVAIEDWAYGSYIDNYTLGLSYAGSEITPIIGSIKINNGALATKSAEVTLGLTVDEGNATEMSFSNDSLTWSKWEPVAATKAWTLKAGEGIKKVYVKFRDEYGNKSGAISASIDLDTEAPVVEITSPTSKATNDNTPALFFNSDETGVTKVFVDGVAVNKTNGSSLNTLADGNHTVKVEVTDSAGNIGSDSVTFKVDTKAPTITISSPANGSITNDTTPLLTYSIGESGASVKVKVDNVIVSKISGNSLNTLSNGTHTVRVEATDSLGNFSYAQTTFKVDTVKPTGTIKINNGATYATSTAATLNLAASDTNGVAKMAFSNNGTTWTSWEKYATSKRWTLPSGSGTKKVYVKFLDRANNSSIVYSDTIVLDTVKPTAAMSSVPLYSTNVSKTTTFPLRWSGSDASGIASYDIQYRVGGSSTWNNWLINYTGTSATFNKASAGNTYYFRVRAKDKAGNYGSYTTAAYKTIVPYDNNSLITSRTGFSGLYSSSASNYYLGTARYSNVNGNQITYTFTGKSVALIAAKLASGAKAKIYVDGRYIGTYDTYRSSTAYRQVIFKKSWSSVGRHTIKIVNQVTSSTKKNLYLDGLAVEK